MMRNTLLCALVVLYLAASASAECDDRTRGDGNCDAGDWAYDYERAGALAFGDSAGWVGRVASTVGAWLANYFGLGSAAGQDNLDFVKTQGENYATYNDILAYSRGLSGTDSQKVEQIYNYVQSKIADDQTLMNNMREDRFSMSDALAQAKGVCQHKAAIIASALTSAGIRAGVVFNQEHAWVRVSEGGRSYDLDPNLYQTYVPLPSQEVGGWQVVWANPTGGAVSVPSANDIAVSPESVLNKKICSHINAKIGRVCFYVNVPTIVYENSTWNLELWQVYGNSTAVVSVFANPLMDFNFTGFQTKKTAILLGNSQDMKEAYSFDVEYNNTRYYFLYTRIENYVYGTHFVQVVSDAPILENELLMRMLTGRENIQLPPPVRQRQEKTPEPEKPDELHNNPLFIILIPILMIGIVATIASATRPKRRKVKIAVIMGLAAGVAVMLLMLVDAPPGKAVSCSEMEQTVVIALDISRSMGDPLLGSNETKFAAGKRAVSDLIRGFGNDTKYSIIDFHMGKADIYYTDKTAPPNRVYGPTAVRTVEEAEAFIGNPNNKYLFEKADEETVISKNLPLSYGWSTSIQPALLAGMAILKHSDSPIKRIIVLTDGQETLNITELAANYALPIEIDAVMLLSEDYDSEYFDPPTPEDVVEWTAGEIYEASDYANVLESLRKAATVCR